MLRLRVACLQIPPVRIEAPFRQTILPALEFKHERRTEDPRAGSPDFEFELVTQITIPMFVSWSPLKASADSGQMVRAKAIALKK